MCFAPSIYISPSTAPAVVNNVKQVWLTAVAQNKWMTAGKMGNCHNWSANKQNIAGRRVQTPSPHDEV